MFVVSVVTIIGLLMKTNNQVSIIEFIANTMIQYDKNNPNKTWIELADVAYNAVVLYLLVETGRINNNV